MTQQNFKPFLSVQAELEKVLPYPQLIPVFLLICDREPIPLNDINKALNLEQFQVSRHVSALGKVYKSNRQKHDGPDLVYTEEDPENRSRKIAFLTTKGKRLKTKLLKLWKGKDSGKS